jgi:peptide/nickel transport system permease protein
VSLGWLPTGGYVPMSESFGGWLATVTLPALTLGLVQVGFIARMARASMLEALGQDFVRTADAKGLSRLEIVVRHGLPNALIPILTVIGIVAGALLGGAVIIEQVFSIPGVGRLIIGAVAARDFPVMQGGLLFLAVVYLAVNLLVDILYAVVDPRVRLT